MGLYLLLFVWNHPLNANSYCGLRELSDVAFVLREDDPFCQC
jgi:hypothetical protein